MMSTQNVQHTIQQDDAPTYERINGSPWWGAGIVGLAFAAIGFLMHLSAGNVVGPLVFAIALGGSYAPMFRKNFQGIAVKERSSIAKSALGIVLLTLLFAGIFIITVLEKSGLFNVPLALTTGAISGIIAFSVAKFLLPTIRQIPDDRA